ncbi:MAG: hypothetical protein HKN76_15925 [Saprospiraceae bacterium]|nr:hypothetical protein [Saprospiraceae bacterium]
MEQSKMETYEDEITLKELILKVREYWKEIWKHWLLIGLIALPFVIFKIYQAYTSPITFPATLTFMVDEDEGNSLGAMAGILGQFGFGSTAGGKYNLDKILEVSRSRRVLQMALFSACDVDGQRDLIANHLIRQFDLHDKWKKDTTGLKNFLYTSSNPQEFNQTENKVLKVLQGVLNGTEKKEGCYDTSYDEDTGIMRLKIETPSESLSITLVDTIFTKLTSYYVGSSIEKAGATYAVMKSKTDSLARALASAEYRLADYIDKNKNVFSAREGALQQTRLQTEVQRLQIMHGEALKNLEYADFTLRNKTPFITLLDDPIAPIKPQAESKLKALVLGLILGTMLGVTFIIGRKIYRDTMNS